ncbi:MAG: molybdopterin-dependent oxidoreductase [Candidatus Rokubacteria bacterium]|nr:molybdopterin-dependent oxidoreductase [Candidatus Rokubacteria bacterium]
MSPAPRFVGSEVKRLEDPRLLRGQAQYVDDLTLSGLVHGLVLRSPHAHARIVRLDAGRAAEQPGVCAVFTARDLEGHMQPKPLILAPPNTKNPPRLALAQDRVRCVGDPVAFVVALDRAIARDAAELIEVEYDPLPAALDPEAALAPGAPQVYPEAPGNIAYEHAWSSGDVDAAFGRAHRVVRLRLVNQRLAAVPLEPRGSVAQWQADSLTFWTSTQGAHKTRSLLAETLGVPEHAIRVIAPDVGGGFGVKFGLYDEEVLTAFAARRLGRPVKWIETRSESMVATFHGRGIVHVGELAVASDGTFLGLRVTGVGDMGAHLEGFTCLPPILCGRLVTGAYRIPAASYAVRAAFTHKAPTGPYRGAGRPEAAYLIERLVDTAARELSIDPVEIRKKNFVRDGDFPFKSPSGLTYDSGRYALTLERALAILGYEAFRQEQARAWTEGRYLGVGLSTFVETASTGPSRTGALAAHEYGSVRVEASGRVTALTGTSPHGQGTATTLAQIVADALGVTPEDVTVLHGDTAIVPMGFGTGGSRAATVGGTAILQAALTVREKAMRIAAHLLEAAAADLEFDAGRFHVRGLAEKGITLAEIARVAHRGAQLPPGMDPGLEAARVWDPPDFTIPFGVYVAVVEVAPETGEVKLRRFIGVDDVGNVLNPMLLEGQLHGGIAQGVAQALLEEIVYDETGQLLSGSLMDYAVPKADDLLAFELDRTVTPTPVNPLGAKGVGEAGCVGAPQAVVNAVVDALRPLGVSHIDMPLRPEKVWRLFSGSAASRGRPGPRDP